MKKLLLPLAALSASVFFAGAQVSLSLDEQLRVNIARNGITDGAAASTLQSLSVKKTIPSMRALPVRAGAETVRVLVRVESEEVLAALESEGLVVRNEIAGTYIADAPLDKVEKLAAKDGVKGFQLSRRLHQTLDRARKTSFADEVFAPAADLPKAFTGAGVVVGIFDGGIDPNHINFQTPDGAPRVKALWVYDEYGSEDLYLTPSRIQSFKDDEYGTQYESCSHGTHTLGILSGSFHDSSLASDYRGVARGADIVVCAGVPSTDNLLAGLKRMSEYAKSVGKPLVVNMSLGDNIGPHDGTDEFGAAANKLCREENIHLFISAGNEGLLRGSCVGTIGEGKPFRTFLSKGDDMKQIVGTAGQAYGQLEVYSQDDTPQQVYLDIIDKNDSSTPLETFALPLNETVYYQTPDFTQQSDFGIYGKGLENEQFSKYWKQSFFLAKTTKYPGTNRTFTEISLQLKGKMTSYSSRYFFAIRVEGTPGKKVFCYDMLMGGGYDINRYVDNGIEGYTAANGNATINNMACGPDVVAVGSYNSGSPKQTYDYAGEIVDVSDFSSWGETNDGRMLPQICAPGSCLVSSMSSWFASSQYYEYYKNYFPKVQTYRNTKTGKSYYWTEMSGTSMSSPFMAGSAALWLEANPELTTKEIVAIAQETSVAPTSTLPNWGASGSLNVYAGLKKVLGISGIVTPAADNDGKGILFQNLGEGLYEVFAAGCDSFQVNVSDMMGRTVKTVDAAGSTAEVSVGDLTPGIYVMTAATGNATKSLKIAVR